MKSATAPYKAAHGKNFRRETSSEFPLARRISSCSMARRRSPILSSRSKATDSCGRRYPKKFKSGVGAGPNRHDKIVSRRRSGICNSVLIVRADETYSARAELVTFAIHGYAHRAFPDQPHFGVHVMVRRMRRAAGRK